MEGGEEVAIITAKRPQGPEESVRCKDLRGRCEGIKRCDGEEIAIKISLKGLKGQKSPSEVAGSAYFNQSEWKKKGKESKDGDRKRTRSWEKKESCRSCQSIVRGRRQEAAARCK